MKVESRKTFSLKFDPDNARRHDDINLAAIEASLKRFGQQKPIVINKDGVVLAGNGTLMAAKKLDWQEIAVVVAPAEWTEEEAKAFAIADNRTNDLSGWNNEQLLDVMSELSDDLILAAGFTQESIDALHQIWGDAPDLDDLFKEHGEPTDEDGMTRVSFIVPADVADRWKVAIQATGVANSIEATILAIDAAYDALVDAEDK
jgi:hypothetical protein